MQRKKISFGEKQLAETAETKRDPPPSNQRGKKISEQLWVVPSFSPFFFSVFLFFPTTYCLGLVHPCHFIVSVGGGRPSLIESAVLYLLGPPQPFVCFSPISVALFLSFPHPSLSLSLSLSSEKYLRSFILFTMQKCKVYLQNMCFIVGQYMCIISFRLICI